MSMPGNIFSHRALEDVEKINPYHDDPRQKEKQVEAMFDAIAPAYDFMNRAMTFGIDKLWRAKAVNMIRRLNPHGILDVATGTGDLAIKLARTIPGAKITGIDLSEGMLEIGRRKVADAGLADRINMSKADCLSLPMPDNSFDCVTVAYGVRNFEHLDRGYSEMACVIELSVPEGKLVRPLYNLYTRHIIPAVGRLISNDTRAYTYLPESIAAMPQGEKMLRLMTDAGLSTATLRRLTFGTCTIYTARK